MKILVDADSCPKEARDLIMRRALKLERHLIFVANRAIPAADGVEMVICPNSVNSADDRIVELAQSGDLVVTRDVPLAKRLIEKKVYVMDDRGREINVNNINELLSIRNFTVGLADNGMDIERIPHYGKKELKHFADTLDRLLTRINKTNLLPGIVLLSV